jgi:hypothetical protein
MYEEINYSRVMDYGQADGAVRGSRFAPPKFGNPPGRFRDALSSGQWARQRQRH